MLTLHSARSRLFAFGSVLSPAHLVKTVYLLALSASVFLLSAPNPSHGQFRGLPAVRATPPMTFSVIVPTFSGGFSPFGGNFNAGFSTLSFTTPGTPFIPQTVTMPGPPFMFPLNNFLSDSTAGFFPVNNFGFLGFPGFGGFGGFGRFGGFGGFGGFGIAGVGGFGGFGGIARFGGIGGVGGLGLVGPVGLGGGIGGFAGKGFGGFNGGKPL